MIKKLKAYILTSTLAVTMLVPTLSLVTAASVSALAANCTGVAAGAAEGANAAANSSSSGYSGGIGGTTGSQQGVNCSSSNVDTSSIKKLAARITNVFSIIVGAASVIMIIYGGFRYVISGGESGRVGAAKNSLIYAIVGLVIVALAQLIVHFVLNQSTQLGT